MSESNQSSMHGQMIALAEDFKRHTASDEKVMGELLDELKTVNKTLSNMGGKVDRIEAAQASNTESIREIKTFTSPLDIRQNMQVRVDKLEEKQAAFQRVVLAVMAFLGTLVGGLLLNLASVFLSHH